MCTLSRALFEEYTALKAQRGQVDMVDLELAAAHLLSDSSVAGWIQERLDTQVRQLLMDEFQDTSPLQWQTLKSWLGGYAGSGGGQQPMRVFLVGDPKQSIYRFRRADPRVFEAAKQFVLDGLQGDLLSCDHTRRNAPGVITALNLVMGQAVADQAFEGFRPHTTESHDAARISILPDVLRPPVERRGSEGAESAPVWRDTLLARREAPDTSLKQLEAEHVAQAIQALIRDQGVLPEDIFVLSRKRSNLAWVGQALQAHGVPFVAPENTRLIDTAEARDLVALVESLVSPQHDLALAHALRSPVFGVSDDDLMGLAARARAQGGTWWRALMDWRDAPSAMTHAAQALTRWREWAQHAPPHDLLEAILTDGQVRERWVAAVPPAMRTQALAHLHALLAQSLDMDGGRDATPYRWVRALKRLPLTLPARVHPGAVQLLTIHGAKGLEARVVFIVDADAQEGHPNNHTVMVDWPESESRPMSCAFIRSEAKPPPSLASAMAHEHAAQRREELNALYVALTRAREQLVFSRTQPRASNKHGSWWARLQQVMEAAGAQEWAPQGRVGDSMDAGKASDLAAEAQLAVLPTLAPVPTRAATDFLPPEAADAALLGQVVHKALEWLTTVDTHQRHSARVRQVVEAACVAVTAPTTFVPRAELLLSKILDSEALQPWLDPKQVAWAGNEVGMVHGGKTLRIDRLVARDTPTGRQWWVLDYKLQHRPQDLPAYQDQMRQYVDAVSALQPGDEVRAAFITGEGKWVEVA